MSPQDVGSLIKHLSFYNKAEEVLEQTMIYQDQIREYFSSDNNFISFIISYLRNEKVEYRGKKKFSVYEVALQTNNRLFVETFRYIYIKNRHVSSLGDFPVANFLVRNQHTDLYHWVRPEQLLRAAFLYDDLTLVEKLYFGGPQEEFQELLQKKAGLFTPLKNLVIRYSPQCLDFMMEKESTVFQLEELSFLFETSLRLDYISSSHLYRKIVEFISSSKSFHLELPGEGKNRMRFFVQIVSQEMKTCDIVELILRKDPYFDFLTWLSLSHIGPSSGLKGYHPSTETQIEQFESLLWAYLKSTSTLRLRSLSKTEVNLENHFHPQLPQELKMVWSSYLLEPESTFLRWSQKYDSRKELAELRKVIRNKFSNLTDLNLWFCRSLHPDKKSIDLLRWLTIYLKTDVKDLQDYLLLALEGFRYGETCLPDIFS